jgi:hypothetical protein
MQVSSVAIFSARIPIHLFFLRSINFITLLKVLAVGSLPVGASANNRGTWICQQYNKNDSIMVGVNAHELRLPKKKGDKTNARKKSRGVEIAACSQFE